MVRFGRKALFNSLLALRRSYYAHHQLNLGDEPHSTQALLGRSLVATTPRYTSLKWERMQDSNRMDAPRS